MPDILLRTKLHIPSMRPDGVLRPRLTRRLNDALAVKLTLLSAPAGFGKTSLLSEWASACDQPIAWLSLDEEDSDFARFLTYMVSALKSIEPAISEAPLTGQQSPQPAPAHVAMSTLINEIASIDSTFVLVLDDYHNIESQAIHDALAFLLDHMPPQMHLVIATRADPPLPLARLRARGQLAELRAADLRFTLEEAQAFLSQVMGLELSVQDLTALGKRTEGWIAGLQLAALSMQGRSDPSSFVAAFAGSHEYVADFLTSEVLAQQPEHIRSFLLKTSILDRLSGPLCDAVTGQDNGQATLEALERANLFIVPLDDERRWHRYHRLFADLLRQRLQHVHPSEVGDLHRRASAWYERQGHLPEAIRHALAADNHVRAAALIDQVAEATMLRSEFATLLGWVEQLPDSLVRERPSLCAFHAWALLMAGQPIEVVEAWLRDAAPGQAAPLQAYVALFQGQLDEAHALAEKALEQLPAEAAFLRSVAVWVRETAELHAVDLRTGSRLLAQLAGDRVDAGSAMTTVLTLCGLAEYQMRQGKLYEARASYERAMALATDTQGNPLPAAGLALIGLGMLAYEWNDLESAARHLADGVELAARWSAVGTLDGHLGLSWISRAWGDFTAAHAALHTARQLAERFDATELDDLIVDLVQARTWIAQGRLDEAERWAAGRGLVGAGDPLALIDGVSYTDYHLRHHEVLMLARLRIAQGRDAEALGVLDTLLAVMEQRNWHRSRREIEVQILRALASQALACPEDALDALAAALELAEPGGYVRTFVDEGSHMAQLLHEAAARGISAAYAGRLLTAFPAAAAAFPSPELPDGMVEPLSERELEVLELMAEGLTNPEIAKRLILSPNTVKVHARNIYGKLDVRNRTQAAARARALGLLR